MYSLIILFPKASIDVFGTTCGGTVIKTSSLLHPKPYLIQNFYSKTSDLCKVPHQEDLFQLNENGSWRYHFDRVTLKVILLLMKMQLVKI